MRRPEDIRAMLARHGGGKVIGQIPAMFASEMTAAEAEFRQRLLLRGHSSGYLALLGLTAGVELDSRKRSATEEAGREQGEWLGYHRGLRTALACVLMHETDSDVRETARQVAKHIEALIGCRLGEGSAMDTGCVDGIAR